MGKGKARPALTPVDWANGPYVQDDDVTCYLLIDTDQYAGNFERALGSWMVGMSPSWGDHGDLEAEAAQLDAGESLAWTEDAHSFVTDDRGAERVAWIDVTPDTAWEIHTVGLAFTRRLTQDEVRQLWERAQRFVAAYVQPADWDWRDESSKHLPVIGTPTIFAPKTPIRLLGWRLLEVRTKRRRNILGALRLSEAA